MELDRRAAGCVPPDSSPSICGSMFIDGSATAFREPPGSVGAPTCGCGSVAILAAEPMPLGSTVILFIPPAFAGPGAIPPIGTFPVPAEPAGRENAAIAPKPVCPPPWPPPRANDAAGEVRNMDNAIATFTEALDIGSATMIYWNDEAMGFT
jgi:hypothetical protein